MIRINKRAANEPQSWKDYKNTPGAKYAPSGDLRNALLSEQGCICAFCMRRIPVVKRDPQEAEFSKIAHILSRGRHTYRELDYDNMVICCPGNINGTAHCDKSQGGNDITLPVFNIQLQQTITYKNYDGSIKSSNDDWDREINDRLCLNNVLLQMNRKQALEGIRMILEKKKWTSAEIGNKLEEWSSFDAEGKLKPYCGIVIWYLEKKLRQIL